MPRQLCPILALALLAPASVAQTGDPGRTPVDQGLADLHSLAASLRTDLAEHPPVDHMTNVYTDPAHPGQFVRADGAIKAVFRNSTYARTRYGVVPTVPAGTVFHFDESAGHSMPGVLVDMRVPDTSNVPSGRPSLEPIRLVHASPEPLGRQPIALRSPTPAPEQPVVNPEPIDSVDDIPERSRREHMVTMSDELYRRNRLREIANR